MAVHFVNDIIQHVIGVTIHRLRRGVHVPGVPRSRCDDDQLLLRSELREVRELDPIGLITMPAVQEVQGWIALQPGRVLYRKHDLIGHVALERVSMKYPVFDAVLSDRNQRRCCLRIGR